jgi:transposase
MEKQNLYLTPFQRKSLQKKLQSNIKLEYRRRIEIMLMADTGLSQSQICKALGCSKETARYWISQAQAGLAHNWHEHSRGRPKVINEQYIKRLKELASNSPRDYDYPFHRWTAQWLSKHLKKELGIEVSARHINRLLSQMGLSLKSKSIADKSATQEEISENSTLVIGDLSSVSVSIFPELEQFNIMS